MVIVKVQYNTPTQIDQIGDSLKIHDILNRKQLEYQQSLINVASVVDVH